MTLQGYGLAAGLPVATLGGRGLELLTATDRELVFAVDPGTPPGPHEMLLAVDGADLPSRVVTVH